MPLVKSRELKRQYELDGPRATVASLSEAIQEEHLKPEDFSIRDLFESLVEDGEQIVRKFDPRRYSGFVVQEAIAGVDVTAFSNITGQIVYSKMLDAYQNEAFVASSMIPNIPTRFDGEKIPGIAGIVEQIDEVRPNMEFPYAGFGEDWIETPSTTKRGLIVPVNKEAIFFDRTNLILSRAGEVGMVLGLKKEKQLLDLLMGITNSYKWKGTTYNTYQTSTPWINVKSGNTLVDWTDVDNVEQLFAAITDPNTNEPVLVVAKDVLVMPDYVHTANRVFGAKEIRYTGSGAATETLAANPLSGYNVKSSRLAKARLVASGVSAADAAKYWFVGDFAKAFAYMENWPLTVVQAPDNSEPEFTQDIVARFKASERGAGAVINPRYAAKSYES